MQYKLDIDHLKTYINANDVVIKKLLTSFINNIPQQLTDLKRMALENNAHETAELAHKLKTPFLYFGLNDVAARLENIEQNIVSIDHTFILQEIDSITTIGKDCAEQAQQEIDKLP